MMAESSLLMFVLITLSPFL